MEQKEIIEAEKLLEEVRAALKDVFIAKIHKSEDGLKLKFSNGQTFTLALWENKK